MKKIFATFMIMATMAIMLPLAASAQTYSTRRVYRNGRWQTVRVYTAQSRNYGRYNRARVTPQEQRRLARERYRLYQQRNRISRDGVITRKEARRYYKSRSKYGRTVRKVRNN